jgi:hypothetical protein
MGPGFGKRPELTFGSSPGPVICSIRVSDEEQTPEEIEAHYAPGGPVVAAQDFTRALFEHEDLRRAWKLAEEDEPDE